MVTDKQIEAAALALLNTGCVREPVAATESFMLARARSMARAALEAADAAAWEPIESAPKDKTPVIVQVVGGLPAGRMFVAQCMKLHNDEWWTLFPGYAVGPESLRRWRPLPQPPKETT